MSAPDNNLLVVDHDKDAAKRFLKELDSSTDLFTFQFFSEDKSRKYAEVYHGTLDEVWAKIRRLNTPTNRVGVYVTVNETDLRGRRRDNIKRVRAHVLDADGPDQVRRCEEIITRSGAEPTMRVHSSQGKAHYYYVVDDVCCQDFTNIQEVLIEEFGTDAAVKDLSRVMRLPGTLHLKDPNEPKLVTVKSGGGAHNRSSKNLLQVLGLTIKQSALPSEEGHAEAFSNADRDRLRRLFGDCLRDNDELSAGIEANTEEIKSALAAIPPSAIASETEWMKVARGLAHHAFIYAGQAEEFWEILDTASAAAPGYDRGDNWARWTRYIDEAMERSNPITIATVFAMAKRHGWMGWVPLALSSQSNLPNQPGGLSSITAGLDVTFANLPHRQFLYGNYASRGEITVLAAPGGMGKSSLAIGIGVDVAVGRDFLQEKIWGDEHTTLYGNGEDSGEEMKRRILAYCLQHCISEAAIKRFRLLGADDWRTQKISFLRTEKGNSILDEEGIQFLELLLQKIRPDLLVLDPLVSFCGGGNVNDNAVMALVMRALKRLATKFNCAILVVHHTRKGGEPGTAEAISGASSIVNLARRAIMVVPMEKEEAKVFGILPSEHRSYFKVVSAKSNLAPPSDDCPWHKLESVTLLNPEPPTYPKGDNVQAVVRVALSSLNRPSDPDHEKIKKAVLDVVDQGKSVGTERVPYSPNLSGAHNARALINDAMVAAQAATAPRPWHDADLNAAVTRAISDLKADGALIETNIKGGRFRRGRGLGVDWEKSPWKSKSNDVAPQGTDADAAEQVPT